MSNTTSAVQGARHPANIGHLVMGLAFAGLLGIWALIVGDVVDGDDIRWLLPLPWVFAGAIGLLAVTLATRRRSAGPDSAETSEPVETPDPAAPTETVTTDTTETTDTEEIR